MDRGNLCLHELFEEQACRTPEETAVADEQGELTYGELDRKADRLAAVNEVLVEPRDEPI